MNDKKYSEAIDEFKKVTKDDGELFSNAQNGKNIIFVGETPTVNINN